MKGRGKFEAEKLVHMCLTKSAIHIVCVNMSVSRGGEGEDLGLGVNEELRAPIEDRNGGSKVPITALLASGWRKQRAWALTTSRENYSNANKVSKIQSKARAHCIQYTSQGC